MRPHSRTTPIASVPSPPLEMAWAWWSIALGAAIGVAGYFLDISSAEAAPALLASGLMFALYATGCLRAGGVRPLGVLIAVFFYGALFQWWGIFLGLLLFIVGGMFGLPQAALTMVVFRVATRSWIPGIGCIAGLALGWGAKWMLSGTLDVSIEAVMALWHLAVVVSLVVWLNKVRLPENRRRLGLCTHCGYNRTGLPPVAVCPECGAAPTGG